MPKIALQLYTVRDVANTDYDGTIRKVAQAGYHFVETAGFPGTTPEKASVLFKELGLGVVSMHGPMPLGDHKNAVLDAAQAMPGKPRLICPGVHPDDLKTDAGVRGLCERLNQANENARALGFQFGFHNHWLEYSRTEEGHYPYELMLEQLAPNMFFELDTYWIKFAGLNPVDIIKQMGSRAPLLHIKDGPINREEPMTAVGEGKMNWGEILKAGQNADYWIVEMDRVAGDPIEEVRKSYNYLKDVKL